MTLQSCWAYIGWSSLPIVFADASLYTTLGWSGFHCMPPTHNNAGMGAYNRMPGDSVHNYQAADFVPGFRWSLLVLRHSIRAPLMAHLTTKRKIVSCKHQAPTLQPSCSQGFRENAVNRYPCLCTCMPTILQQRLLDILPWQCMLIFCATGWWELREVMTPHPLTATLASSRSREGGSGWQPRLLSYHHTPSHSSIRGFLSQQWNIISTHLFNASFLSNPDKVRVAEMVFINPSSYSLAWINQSMNCLYLN